MQINYHIPLPENNFCLTVKSIVNCYSLAVCSFKVTLAFQPKSRSSQGSLQLTNKMIVYESSYYHILCFLHQSSLLVCHILSYLQHILLSQALSISRERSRDLMTQWKNVTNFSKEEYLLWGILVQPCLKNTICYTKDKRGSQIYFIKINNYFWSDGGIGRHTVPPHITKKKDNSKFRNKKATRTDRKSNYMEV